MNLRMNKWKNLFIGSKLNILKRLKRFSKMVLSEIARYDEMKVNQTNKIQIQYTYVSIAYTQLLTNGAFRIPLTCACK